MDDHANGEDSDEVNDFEDLSTEDIVGRSLPLSLLFPNTSPLMRKTSRLTPPFLICSSAEFMKTVETARREVFEAERERERLEIKYDPASCHMIEDM